MNRTCNAIFAAVSVALTIGVASMPAHADGTIDKGILKIGSGGLRRGVDGRAVEGGGPEG